jgi:DNA-binding GntR family transcriptional regulator
MVDEATRKLPSAEIYADMKDRLASGKFIQGSRLRAEKIRAGYGCSASTMREILFRLACEGHVEAIDQKGFRVPMGTAQIRTELIGLRVILEKEGLRLSLLNGDLEWEAQLSASFHKLNHIEETIAESGRIIPYLKVWNQAEFDFHRSLISACGSALLMDTHRNIYDRFRQHLVGDDTSFGFRRENIREHRQILETALTRDLDQCQNAIEIHIDKDLTRRSKYHQHAALA